MEKELDDTKESVNDLNRELLNVARKEAEASREELIRQENDSAQKTVEKARKEAEDEAAEILSKADGDVKRLKTQIDKTFDRAVDLVIDVVLGEKSAS